MKRTAKKWYVEYRTYGRNKWNWMIVEAENREAAIEAVNKRVIGATHFRVMIDDGAEES